MTTTVLNATRAIGRILNDNRTLEGFDRHTPTVRSWGKVVHMTNGVTGMRKVFETLKTEKAYEPYLPAIAQVWDGIGEWSGQ